MVANGTMGLLDRRVMTLRSMGHGPWGCETNGPPLTCYCVLGSLLWQKAAQWGISAAHRSFFEPLIEAPIVPLGSISGSARYFGSKTEAPLSYFLTKRAQFCALGPHCGDFCHLPWGIIKG